MRKSGGSFLVFAILALLVFGMLWLLGYFVFPVLSHELWSFVRIGFPILGAILISVILLVIPSTGTRFTGTLFALGAIFLMFVGPWVSAQNNFKAVHYEETTYDKLSYHNRAPFDVASRISSAFLGSESGTVSGTVKSTPSRGDAGQYSTSIIEQGVGKGYSAVQVISLPLYGTAGNNGVNFCYYNKSKAGYRLGGMTFWNSLDKKIAQKTSASTLFERSDALATCEGENNETPILYIPLTKLNNSVFFPQRVFGGVMVYNGSTGELNFYDNLDTDLPLYPQSLAKSVREATHAKNGWFNWFFHLNTGGYDDTAKDADDPNGDNRSEFGLTNENRSESYYITPLTTKGSSTSISALGQIESSGKMTAGEFRDFKVFKAPNGLERSANSNIASNLMNMLAEKAVNMEVMEIIPSQNGNWVASIGTNQIVKYRAIINKDENIDIYDKSGNLIVTTRDSAKKDDDGVTKDDSSGDDASKEKETSKDSDKDGVTRIPTNGKKLSEMSTDELSKTMEQITAELAKRAKASEK